MSLDVEAPLVGLHDVDGLAHRFDTVCHFHLDALRVLFNEVHSGDTTAIHLAEVDGVCERSTSKTEFLTIFGTIHGLCLDGHAVIVRDVDS